MSAQSLVWWEPPASGCLLPVPLLPEELLEVLQLGNNPAHASAFNSAGARISGPLRRGWTCYIGRHSSEPTEFPSPVETAAALAPE